MTRKQIIEQLNAYALVWREESAKVRRFVEFVLSHPNCFERSLKIGHVTGSAWVVNKAGTHVLLTHHRKLNKWFQLGGHADGDGNILRVAKREVLEESGLNQITPVSEQIFDIDIHPIPGHEGEPEHVHYDVRYALQVTGDEKFAVSEESHDLSWVEIEKLEERTNEISMLRMAAKWKALFRNEIV